MTVSPSEPRQQPRDDSADVDEAVSRRRAERAFRRAESERVGRIHAGLLAPRLPEGER